MLSRRKPRRAAAAVEFAFLAPVVFALLLGLWQVDRIVEVKQLMDNAAREGARLAAQAQIVNVTGEFTQVHTSTGSPNLQDTVREYLAAAGVVDATTVNDVTVQFQFLDNFNDANPHTEPYQGAKGERFQVTVTLPVQDVNWTPFNAGSATITSQVTWEIMVDAPFTVNTTVPGWNPP
jgi:Flp pilus assembly protein TadG